MSTSPDAQRRSTVHDAPVTNPVKETRQSSLEYVRVCSCVAISAMTRLRVVWVTGMLVVVGGCEATHPVADPADTHPPPPERILVPGYLEAAPGSGVVSVTRDAGSENSACTLQVRVDARPVALLHTSERIILHLPPGKHILSVTGEGGNVCGPSTPDLAEMQAVQVTVAPEHPVDARVGFDGSGRIHIATQR